MRVASSAGTSSSTSLMPTSSSMPFQPSDKDVEREKERRSARDEKDAETAIGMVVKDKGKKKQLKSG